jgi:hypothetical protein
MIHELRVYQSAPGRMAEMDAMMSRDCTQVLRRHGIPTPLGAWVATAGPRLPAYIWILGWTSMEARNKGWAGFGTDPEWQRIRRDAHATSELTVRVDTHFMAAWPELSPAGDAWLSPRDSVSDLWFMRIHTGFGGVARKAFLQHDEPLLGSLGARVEAAFDLLSGDGLPVIACAVRWPDPASRNELLERYDTHPDLRAARSAEHASHGFDVFSGCDRYVLRAASPFGAA